MYKTQSPEDWVGNHLLCLGVWLSLCWICTNLPITSFPGLLYLCEESISKEDLLTSFLYYVTTDNREVLTKCLSGDLDCQDDDLLELLSSYKCFKLPNKDNIKVLLTELAHQEIIQKQRYVAQCWSPVIISLKSDLHFCSVKSIKELFWDLSPSAKKVIKALELKANNESEKQIFEILKQFIQVLRLFLPEGLS